MPVRIAPRSNGHESQGPDSCEPGTENLEQPGAPSSLVVSIILFLSFPRTAYFSLLTLVFSSRRPRIHCSETIALALLSYGVSLPVLYTYQSPLWAKNREGYD